MNYKLEINKSYTLVAVVDKITVKVEVIITDYTNGKYSAKRRDWPIPEDVPADLAKVLVFAGHNLPLLIDSQTFVFNPNGKFNFITSDREGLKAYLLHNCLNLDNRKRAKIYTSPVDRMCRGKIPYTRLFPANKKKIS